MVWPQPRPGESEGNDVKSTVLESLRMGCRVGKREEGNLFLHELTSEKFDICGSKLRTHWEEGVAPCDIILTYFCHEIWASYLRSVNSICCRPELPIVYL